jgi:hypothetical protein
MAFLFGEPSQTFDDKSHLKRRGSEGLREENKNLYPKPFRKKSFV